MADISKCVGVDHSLCAKCLREQAQTGPMQSWVSPALHNDDCPNFLNVEDRIDV